MKQWLMLAAFLGVSYLAAGIGSSFTMEAIPTWYAGLAKPSFNPPNWIFAPVWTTLYTLMAIAAWLVWRADGPRMAFTIFGVQLVLNVLWSILFFGQKRPDLAAVEVVLLWLAILATLLVFWRVKPLAGAMFVPYLAWVSFAAILNFSIWRLNPV